MPRRHKLAPAPDPTPTVNQRILLAAYRLEAAGTSPVSAEALVVAAWQANPETFGLAGFMQAHPCSNRVLACLMGSRGLVRHGFIEKVAAKRYRLTEHGRDEAMRVDAGDIISNRGQKRRLNKVELPPHVRPVLAALIRSRAYAMWKAGGVSRDAVQVADIQAFLDLAERAFSYPVGANRVMTCAIGVAEHYLLKGAVTFDDGAGGELTVTARQLAELRDVFAWVIADRRWVRLREGRKAS